MAISHQYIAEFWKESNIFSKSIEQNKLKPTFNFYDGPPFMTGLPHYGHILAGLIKDSVLRFAHDSGHNVPRHAGADTHGLPIEFEIEKDLGIKTTEQVITYGLSNYNEACRSIVMRYATEWEDQMGKLGRWIDFKRDYKTMTKEFMNSTWWVFAQLYKKGRVYEGVRIMPYSTTCGTPLSNFETQQNYQEVQDDSLYLTLPLINQFEDKEVSLMVWTTTPWTLPANCAICVNSTIEYVLVKNETKYYILANKLLSSVFKATSNIQIISTFTGDKLIGLKYQPAFMFNTMQPANPDKMYTIMSDPYVSDESGTGLVHLAPSYGDDDYRVCIMNGLITKETKLFQPLDTNGFVSADIPTLKGMFYKNYKDKSSVDLNTHVVMELKKLGNYYDKRQITHNYPFCWRSDTPLIYRAVSSWFVKVEDMRDKLTELNKQINWVPKSVGASRFDAWLGSARDWGVSRSRFWGTPIPIWRNISDESDVICVGSSYELEELAGLNPGSIKDLHRHFIDDIIINKDGKTYKRIPEILDCWFESGSMPYGSIGLVGIVELLRNSDSGIELNELNNLIIRTRDGQQYQILPADFIAEGLDQTRGWFYTLLVLSASLFDQIPFKNVIVNGLVLAEDGKKMSKRLKNYPDPMEIVNEFGSDCLRLYLLNSQATRAEPLKFVKDGVRNMMRDIIIPFKSSINFLKEYYNMYQSQNAGCSPFYNIQMNMNKLTNPINIWILMEYGKLRREYNAHMVAYNLRDAIAVLFKLVQILNNGYIKLGRSYLKGRDGELEWSQSLSTLYYVLKYFISDFKAIIPFFCEQQYLELKAIFAKSDEFFSSESIHLNQLVGFDTYIMIPEAQVFLATDFDIVYNIIFTGLQLRSMNNHSVKKPLRSTQIILDDRFEQTYSTRYREFLDFIANEVNSLDIKVVRSVDLVIHKEIKPNKGALYKKYTKTISGIYEELNKLTSDELDEFIKVGTYKDIELDESLFIIKSDITIVNQEPNSIYEFKELTFGTNKITVVIDKYYDDEIDRLYYYRLVATKIQRSRKYANLHPWDKINAYYTGISKYNLDSEQAKQIINSICKINLIKLDGQDTFYSKQFEDLDVELYLQMA